MRLDGSSPATLVVEKGGRRWLASVPVTPPGGRAARRRRRQELIAAAAALAAVLAVVMAGCSSRGSPNTQASPARRLDVADGHGHEAAQDHRPGAESLGGKPAQGSDAGRPDPIRAAGPLPCSSRAGTGSRCPPTPASWSTGRALHMAWSGVDGGGTGRRLQRPVRPRVYRAAQAGRPPSSDRVRQDGRFRHRPLGTARRIAAGPPQGEPAEHGPCRRPGDHA